MNLEQAPVQTAVEQQAATSAKPGRLSHHTAARLAWLLLGVSLGLLALMLTLSLVNGSLTYDIAIYLLTFNTPLLVGTLIASRRPENPIGWMFCGAGLTTNLALVLQEYARLALVTHPASLPGGLLTGWQAMLIQPTSWILMFVSLMLFPTGRPATRLLGLLIWVDVLLFAVTITLGAVGRSTLGDITSVHNPLYTDALSVYLDPLSGAFGGFSVLLLGTTALFRFRTSGPIERLQLKWFIYSVAVVTMWSVLQGVLGISGVIKDSISVLTVLLLAVTVAIAVLRYRLYDIDIIINRTLVYVPLTAILAGLYSAFVALLQRLFQTVTGEKSDAAIVLSTLVLTALFTPVKNSLQAFVDRRWKEPAGSLNTLKAFAKQVEESFSPVDPGKVVGRLLAEAAPALRAESGAAYLQKNGQMELIHMVGDWREEDASLVIYLESAGQRLGMIKLGDRRGEADYSNKERKALQDAADVVASAISV